MEPVQLLTPGLHPGISHLAYQNDALTSRPTLNSSTAKVLVAKSPYHAWFQHPRLGKGRVDDPTESMTNGSLLHNLVLGAGPEIVSLPYADWRRDVAKGERDEARAAGKLPVLAHKLEEAKTLAALIVGELKDRGFSLDGQSELTAIWEEDGVLCRARMDHFKPNHAIVLDLKMVESADPESFAKSAINFGYDIQCAAYTSAIDHVIPDLAGRMTFLFVCVESEAPHVMAIYEMTGEFMELGRRKWARAVGIWGDCLRVGSWPDYGRGLLSLAPPGWALAKEEERMAMSIPAGGSVNAPF